MSKQHQTIAIAGFLIGITILLRYFSFFTSVIDHDESTYIVIAQEMLAGKTYLVDLIDTKPVGIFLIYAGMLQLAGNSIVLLRLLTSIWIGITAFLLFRLGERATGSREVGWAAGVLYPLFCSSWAYYGISPNTELFYNLFTVAAVLIVWQAKQGVWPYLFAGLLLGGAFIIKYTIAADAFALGLLVLHRGWRERRFWEAACYRALPMTAIFFLPIGLCTLFYWQIGELDTFYHYTFETTRRYLVDSPWSKRFLFLLEFPGRFLPMSLLAIAGLTFRISADRHWQRFLLIWLLCVGIMVLLPGKRFGHYQIQLMPAAALLAANFFHPFRTKLVRWHTFGWRLLVALYFLIVLLNWNSYRDRPDESRIVVNYLEEELTPGDLVYPGDFHQIVYFLLDQRVLTPYVHSSLLFDEGHIDMLQIDPAAEGRAVLAQKPRFVLLRTDYPNLPLKLTFYQDYRIIKSFPQFELNVWERKYPDHANSRHQRLSGSR